MSEAAWIGLTVVGGGLAAGWLGGVIMARRGRARTDLPDARRLHDQPTARGGGIGIIIAGLFALPFAQWLGGDTEAALIGVALLAWAVPNGFIGLADDYVPLGAWPKLGMQLAAATTAVAFGLRLECLHLAPLPPLDLGIAAYPLSVVGLVWVANVFNFMDGSDGLAAGCGAVMFAALAALGLLAGGAGTAVLAAGVGAGCAGFFAINKPRARIFMGDGGSLFAGACLGAGAVLLTRSGLDQPVSTSLIATAPFWFDATYTLLGRARRRAPLLEAHRQHLYQRLITAGLSSWRVLGLYVGMSLGCGGLAVGFPHMPPIGQGLAWVAVASGLAGLVQWVRRLERKRDASHASDKKPGQG